MSQAVFEQVLMGIRSLPSESLAKLREIKIAIYVDRDSLLSHVARQTRSGTWKSKLGIRGKDIEHDSLELLEGDEQDEYGQVAKLMKKRRYESED
ncbi:MAG TPA: hypothetical protein VE715_22215 [Blastocatellia bacterium]|nr:hypothetical protein [Blastocatellia bacterium]